MPLKRMTFDNSERKRINLPSGYVALLSLILLHPSAIAETVSAKLPVSISVTANFHAGKPSQPAVLMMHGFMQTRQSQPMNSLAGNLASKGYTALSPAISLGINKRFQSMSCEALHTHTAEEDVAEISYWMKWPAQKGYHKMMLAGFSGSGNAELLTYAAKDILPFSKVILISVDPILIDPKEYQTALLKVPRETGKPENYSPSYLSYAVYNENKILELIGKTQAPVEIIPGSADTILPASRTSRVKALRSPVHLTIIEDANHFFDGTHEFELAEKIENILNNIPARYTL